MRTSLARFVSTALAFASVLLPSRAEATGACRTTTHDEHRVVPAFARGAPLNFRPWVDLTGMADAPVVLLRRDGAPVAVTRVPASLGAPLFWIRPDGDLEPQTAYELRIGSTTVLSFETGDARHETPPTLTSLPVADLESTRDLCGPAVGAMVSLSDLQDSGLPGAEVLLEVRAGNAHGFFPVRALDAEQIVIIGDGDERTLGAGRLPGLRAGEEYDATFTLWDTSGHFTETRAPLRVRSVEHGAATPLSEEPMGTATSAPPSTATCAATPSPFALGSPPWMASVVLVVAARRR